MPLPRSISLTRGRRLTARRVSSSCCFASRRFLGRLNVYRLAGASWYGGGGQTACGGSLGSSTLGVANKTLPCGTLVTLRYGGHTLRVPVIDIAEVGAGGGSIVWIDAGGALLGSLTP